MLQYLDKSVISLHVMLIHTNILQTHHGPSEGRQDSLNRQTMLVQEGHGVVLHLKQIQLEAEHRV